MSHGKVVKLLGRAARWHSKRFIDCLIPSSSWMLLDAGCGAGDEILRFHKRVSWIVGVDFSLGMLKVCKKRLDSIAIRNVSLVVADVRQLPFKASSCQASLCMGVLLFLSESGVTEALRELSRVSAKRMLIHGKNSFSPFGAELRLAEKLLKRVRTREPYDYHRPLWWYRRRSSQFGRVVKHFSIGLWIPQLPDWVKSLVGSVEVLAASLGLNHPFGKEYYLTILKKRP